MNGSRIVLRMGSALLFSHFGSLLCAGCVQKQTPPPRPPQVQVARVVEKDVSIYGEWVATLDGYVNAQIQPQVTGYLIKQDYREGSLVNKNDVLFEIDPRPFQAALDQAKAQLAQAEAQLGNATLNVNRDIPEAEANAIPRSPLENDTQMQPALPCSLFRVPEHRSIGAKDTMCVNPHRTFQRFYRRGTVEIPRMRRHHWPELANSSPTLYAR